MLTLIKVNEFPFFLRLYKVDFIWILEYYHINVIVLRLYNRRNNKRGTRETHTRKIKTSMQSY